MTCFWGHKWGKWESYARSYTFIPTGLHKYPHNMIGREFQASETRQKRECLICGYTEDVYLRDGGEPK